MGFEDFWLQSNNGKKYNLKDLKDFKLEDIAKNSKLQKLIKLFDFDESGSIEVKNKNGQNEWKSIFTELQAAAGEDKDLTCEEFGLYLSQKMPNEKLKLEDLNELLEMASGQEEPEVVSIKVDKNTTIYVKKVDGEGKFADEDFVEMRTKDSDGNEIIVKREKIDENNSFISVTKILGSDESLTTFYGTSSYYIYEMFKDEPSLELLEIYTKGEEEYYVQYTDNGTITHAKYGDTISGLIKKFGFKNETEFYKLNPNLEGKILKVADPIVVPGHHRANSEQIVSQGTEYGELCNYAVSAAEKEYSEYLESVRNEYFQNIDKEVFYALQEIKGFELNQENLQMYAKINVLDADTQICLVKDIKLKIMRDMTIDKIKRELLYSRNIDINDGFVLTILSAGCYSRSTATNMFTESEFRVHLCAEVRQPLSNIGDNRTVREGDLCQISIKDYFAIMGMDADGEDKELYEQVCGLIFDSNAQVKMSDINVMLSNIYNRYANPDYADWYNDLSNAIKRRESSDKKVCMELGIQYEGLGQDSLNERKYLEENPPLDQKTAREMVRAVLKKMTATDEADIHTKYDNFIANYTDSQIREFAVSAYSYLSDRTGAYLEMVEQQKDALQLGGNFYIALQRLCNVKAKNEPDRLYLDSVAGNDLFSSSFLKDTGIKYDKVKMQKCMQIFNELNGDESEAAEEKRLNALREAFGKDMVDEWQQVADFAARFDAITDMVVMFSAVGAIGKGVQFGSKLLSKGAKFVFPRLSAKVSAQTLIKGSTWLNKTLQYSKIALDSGLTFGIYGGARKFVNYTTNGIDETQLEAPMTLGEAVWEGFRDEFVFGTFIGAVSPWTRLGSAKITGKLFGNPAIEQSCKEALKQTSKVLSGEFTGTKALSTYNAALQQATATAGARTFNESLNLFFEIGTFSVYDIGKTLLTTDKPEDVSWGEFALSVVGNQATNLLEIKSIGYILTMHRQGKMPAFQQELRKDQELRIKQEGKDKFKVTYPDGKEVYAGSMNEVLALSQMHQQQVLIYDPIKKILDKDGSLDIGDGMKLVKNGENYGVKFTDGRTIVAKDIRVALSQANSLYTFDVNEQVLKKKGELTLGNQKYTYNKETGIYQTVIDGTQIIQAESFKELTNGIISRQMTKSIEEAFASGKKGIVLDGRVFVIKDEATGKYAVQCMSEMGEISTLATGNTVQEVVEGLFNATMNPYNTSKESAPKVENTDVVLTEDRNVVPTQPLTEPGAEDGTRNTNTLVANLNSTGVSYELYHDRNGNEYIRVVASATPRKRGGGYDFTFDIYKFDKDGNFIDKSESVTEQEIKNKYGKLKGRQIFDNSMNNNSGYLYSGIPFISQIDDKVIKDEAEGSVSVPDADVMAQIKRYNELIDQGLSSTREAITLALELTDKGYRFDSDRRIDVNFDPKNEFIPNINMTKTELHNKLKAMQLPDHVVESIEYNVNRINADLFASINDPLIIKEFGASLWIVPTEELENIPARAEAAKILNDCEMIPAKEKGLLICSATKDNIKSLKKRINNIEKNLKYIKDCNIDEAVFDFYKAVMCEDGMEFSLDLFDAIKENRALLDSEVCFNVEKDNVAPKIEMFNIIKDLQLTPEMTNYIIKNCTKDNVAKMKKIEIIRNDQNDKLIEDLYRNIDKFSIEQIDVIVKNNKLLNFYSVDQLFEIPEEDLAAKIEFLSSVENLNNLHISLTTYVHSTTKSNLNNRIAQIRYLLSIDQNPNIGNFDKYSISKILIDADMDVVADFLDLVKDDPAMSSILVLSDVLKCETKEDVKKAIDIYNMVKDIQKADVKVDILKRLNEEGYETLKQKLVEELPLINKLEESSNNIFTVVFDAQGNVQKTKVISDVKRILAKALPGETEMHNKIIELFENVGSIEELNAKYEVLKDLYGRKKIYGYSTWSLLDQIKIKEQADIAIKLHLSSGATNVLSTKFVRFYKGLMQSNIDSDVQIPSNIDSIIGEMKTEQDLERYITLLNDKFVESKKDYTIALDPAKYDLYSQFIRNPLSKKIDSKTYKIIINNISTGVYKTIDDMAKILNEVKLVTVKDTLRKYRNNENVGSKVMYFEDCSTIKSNPERFLKILENTFPGVNVTRLREQLQSGKVSRLSANYSPEGLQVLGWLIENAYSKTFEEIAADINSVNLGTLSRRNGILIECSSEVAYHLAFCSEAEFEKVVSKLEARPEILLNKYDKATFDKLINMSDAEFEALKVPIKERSSRRFDAVEYKNYLQVKLNSEFEWDLSTWHAEERKRLLQTQSVVAQPVYELIKIDESVPPILHRNPVTEYPTAEQLMMTLKKSGRVTLSIADEGGMNPAHTDPAIVHEKPEDLGVYKSTKTSVNIGETRIWDRDRLARDLLQNFYDGNGYTLEGVSIDVVKKGDKYAVTISGKGIFDYQRVLDFGAHSTLENATEGTFINENSYNPDDSRRAGKYGEGSKVLTGNLISNYGADFVRYRSGDWILDLNLSEPNEIGEVVINKRVSRADERLEGTTYEFETDDIELIQSLMKAKDYFYSPANEDFSQYHFGNDYFSIEFLPEGQKGNLYVVQRYEVDGQKGFENTIDGMTIVFKRQPYDKYITKANNGNEYDISKLGTGRNRVGLTKETMTELIERYAMTLDDQQLIGIIGNMRNEFLCDSQSPNVHILKGFLRAAGKRSLKIDFGHNDYLAVSKYTPSSSIEYARSHGKILVIEEMKWLGIPTVSDYIMANKNEVVPEFNLTPVEQKKLIILEEAVRTFSSYLDLENFEIITEAEAEKPKYVVENFTENDNKSISNTLAMAITSGNEFEGHWVLREYLNNGDFFDLLATWLHENSHKVGGDGSAAFNQRLIKLEQLIVDISSTHPDFCEKMAILNQKFNELSGNQDIQNTVLPENIEGLILAEIDKKMNHVANQTNYIQYLEEHPDTPFDIDMVRDLYSPSMQNELDYMNNIVIQRREELARVQEEERQFHLSSHKFKNRVKNFFGFNSASNYAKKVAQAQLDLQDAEALLKNVISRAEAERRGVSSYAMTDMNTYGKYDIRYTRPNYGNIIKPEPIAASPYENMALLLENGSLTIDMPATANTKPKISNSSILQADRGTLGVPETIPLLRDYNASNEWSTDVVARDIMQNFYDGHGGTLDGVKIEVNKVGDKYKIRISGDSEYSYFYLETIGASGGKTQNVRAAGGFGEGSKMACKTLLGQGITNKVTFASGDWIFDFILEQGVSRDKQHVTRVLNENQDRVNGTYVEFETADLGMVESILKAKDYFQHSENIDFKGADYGNNRFEFKILKEGERGNLYYIQRYAIKGNGDLEGALDGIQIVFKEQLTPVEKAEIGIGDDCDRKGFTGEELRKIAKVMSRSMSDTELLEAIQSLERFWIVTDPMSIEEYTPEQNFALGLIDAAVEKGLKFNTEGLKFVAVNKYSSNGDIIKQLKNHGYIFVDNELSKLGFASMYDVMDNINQAHPVNATVVENQKLTLLMEMLPANSGLKLKIFEAEEGSDKVTLVEGDHYIAIDRQYLSEVDFNTLYTQVWSQIAFESSAMDWGYTMTDMLGNQIRNSSNPIFMAKFKACEKKFNELSGTSNYRTPVDNNEFSETIGI